MSAEDTRILERSIVGSLIDHPEFLPLFLERIELNYLSSTAYYAAKALADLFTESEAITVQTVMERMRVRDELVLAGGAAALFEVWTEGTRSFDPEGEINMLANRYALRAASEVGARLTQGIESMEIETWLPWADSEIERIRQISAQSVPAVYPTLGDVLTGEDLTPEWCIPGILPKGTATMLTAEEGVGKSTVLRQMAMAAMAGADPFVPHVRYEPQRVLLIDCENPRNHMHRSLRSMWSYLRPQAPEADVNLLKPLSRQGGLNLSEPKDQGWLHRAVRDTKADLVVIGPVYRFTDADLNTEEGVRSWQRTFEPLLADGITVLTEHHAPNEGQNTVRSLRPIGSSALRRWFAQGIALRARKCEVHDDKFCRDCQRRATVESWRGSREEEARWPRQLVGEHGHTWWSRDERAEVEGSRNI